MTGEDTSLTLQDALEFLWSKLSDAFSGPTQNVQSSGLHSPTTFNTRLGNRNEREIIFKQSAIVSRNYTTGNGSTISPAARLLPRRTLMRGNPQLRST